MNSVIEWLETEEGEQWSWRNFHLTAHGSYLMSIKEDDSIEGAVHLWWVTWGQDG